MKEYELQSTEAYYTPEGIKTRLLERLAKTKNKVAYVDWLSITVKTKSLGKVGEDDWFGQNLIVQRVSDKLKSILGFGVEKENASGRNFYNRSFELEHGAGFIAIGGQRQTVMINLTGTACTFGHIGWEEQLAEWLHTIDYKITRVDLAHDDFVGKYTLDYFNAQDTLGGFTGGGRPPNVENRGNWKRPTGRGRTLYIGSVKSSRYTRIYEKGKQLGEIDSPWVRSEVQYRSKEFYIDVDVLLSPDKYFIASYPCFKVFDDELNPDKFVVIDREKIITFDRALEITRHQFGRYINFFRQVFGDDTKTLDILTDIENKSPPERIDLLTIPIQY